MKTSGVGFNTFAGANEIRRMQVGFPVEITSAYSSTNGYSWRRLVLAPPVTSVTSHSETGNKAYAIDNNETIPVGTLGWLEPAQESTGYIFQPASRANSGCGWMAGVRSTTCLTVTVLGATGDCSCSTTSVDTVLAYSAETLKWESNAVVTVCGLQYAVTFARSTGTPQLYLTALAGGAKYYGILDYCIEGAAVFAFSDTVLCTGTASEGCDNALRLKLQCSGCDETNNLPGVSVCNNTCTLSECLKLTLTSVANRDGPCDFSFFTEGAEFVLRRVPNTYTWEYISDYTYYALGGTYVRLRITIGWLPWDTSSCYAPMDMYIFSDDGSTYREVLRGHSFDFSGCLPASSAVALFCSSISSGAGGVNGVTATATLTSTACPTGLVAGVDCCAGSPDTLTATVSMETGGCGAALAASYTFTRFVGEAWISDVEIASGIWAVLSCGMFGDTSWRLNIDGTAGGGSYSVVGAVVCCPTPLIVMDYTFGSGGVCVGSARFTFSGTC